MSEGEPIFAIRVRHTAEDCPLNPERDNSQFGLLLAENLRAANARGGFDTKGHTGIAVDRGEEQAIQETYQGVLPKHDVELRLAEGTYWEAVYNEPSALQTEEGRYELFDHAAELFPGEGLERVRTERKHTEPLRNGLPDYIEQTLRERGQA